MRLRENLLLIQKSAKLNDQEFLKILGLTPTDYTKILRGSKDLPAFSLARLSALFHLRINSLIYETLNQELLKDCGTRAATYLTTETTEFS